MWVIDGVWSALDMTFIKIVRIGVSVYDRSNKH